MPHGVIAQLARRRIRERGIRLALGAGTRQGQWLIVRHGLTVAGMGAAVGVVIALARGLERRQPAVRLDGSVEQGPGPAVGIGNRSG